MKQRINTLSKSIVVGIMAGMMVFAQGVLMSNQLGVTMKNVYAESAMADEIQWSYNV